MIHQIDGWVVNIKMNSTLSPQQSGDFRAFLNEVGISFEPPTRVNIALVRLSAGESPIDVMRRYQVVVVSHGSPDKSEIEAFRYQFTKGLGYCPETGCEACPAVQAYLAELPPYAPLKSDAHWCVLGKSLKEQIAATKFTLPSQYATSQGARERKVATPAQATVICSNRMASIIFKEVINRLNPISVQLLLNRLSPTQD